MHEVLLVVSVTLFFNSKISDAERCTMLCEREDIEPFFSWDAYGDGAFKTTRLIHLSCTRFDLSLFVDVYRLPISLLKTPAFRGGITDDTRQSIFLTFKPATARCRPPIAESTNCPKRLQPFSEILRIHAQTHDPHVDTSLQSDNFHRQFEDTRS